MLLDRFSRQYGGILCRHCPCFDRNFHNPFHRNLHNLIHLLHDADSVDLPDFTDHEDRVPDDNRLALHHLDGLHRQGWRRERRCRKIGQHDDIGITLFHPLEALLLRGGHPAAFHLLKESGDGLGLGTKPTDVFRLTAAGLNRNVAECLISVKNLFPAKAVAGGLRTTRSRILRTGRRQAAA